MNWFDTSGLTSLAKSALKEAQKTIDKALDIQDESDEEEGKVTPSEQVAETTILQTANRDTSDFFSSWGLTLSGEEGKECSIKEQPVVTASPSKTHPQSLWGSFAGSFFEQAKSIDGTIVKPPKAKSMNVIADKYDSQDDMFSKSQLVMSDGNDIMEKANECKTEDRRKSSLTNALSFVSSRNSSESVEVLSQSLKTTPDSEGASYQSVSQSSSTGFKANSESVEILPDSLVSPSSIECLGFDSYTSDKNSSTSSNSCPSDGLDKKSTPLGEHSHKVETADSVSLVADDDEDTMSYNSISECTAPTVLDTDEKPLSPIAKMGKSDQRKIERELMLEQIIPQKIQMSENSSNDGSWSDRTLNADCDSLLQENNDKEKKDADVEDILIEKLSDSSSFYNVNVTGGLVVSESSVFVNAERQRHSPPGSNDSSQKDCSIKERTSTTSSDSKSELVKIGSDRTSGHTSGDEVETATSSDIEIIPSPNGDNGHCSRSSPGKYAFRHKMDGTTSPNLVDLVLGKNLATKIRGHTRELSDASIKSNLSDESQGSENEILMRRLSEMADILDARESRLMEVSRNNAELAENNAHLKSQMECLLAKQESSDLNTITEDYTQRLSALEKKFQQAIREKDHLRKQLDNLKLEIAKKNATGVDALLKEKEDIIAQLQEEGEKLARQELQHTNIIKKLRSKERDNEQVIKGLRDKIAEQTAELDRMKRSLAAKEEAEVSQIEAVYRLSAANKRLDAELAETKSALDDTTQKLESARTSLEVARREINELQRSTAELQKLRDGSGQLEALRDEAERRAERLERELRQLRAERSREEARWLAREEALRRELAEARQESALRHETPHAALLDQLAALQRAAVQRDRARDAAAARLAEAETLAAKATERERLAREESAALARRLDEADCAGREAQRELQQLRERVALLDARGSEALHALDSKARQLEEWSREAETRAAEAARRLLEAERLLAEERVALDTERKRNSILQEQLSSRADEPPPRSGPGDSLSAASWNEEAGAWTSGAASAAASGVASAAASGVASGAASALLAERDVLRTHLAALTQQLQDTQSVQEQYEALLEMYGEKEEQLEELKLDLHDVTQLYKQQIHELVALRQQVQRTQSAA